MTSGFIVIGALVGMDVVLTGWALVGLGKLRMDQQTALGMLKWLWQKELKRQTDYKNGIKRES